MRVVVLGASGMLGHKLVQACAPQFATLALSRTPVAPAFAESLPAVDFRAGYDVSRLREIDDFLHSEEPDAVVNCIGIVNKLAAAQDPVSSITVNSLFPHQLAEICGATGARLIHISTDCVFSGARGEYTERDVPDAEDQYGRTKLLGELDGPGCLTLRTSIIGRELEGRSGLAEWFLSQTGTIEGYTKAYFSGLTTIDLAELITRLLIDHHELEGLWHVSGEKTSKYEVMRMMRDAFGKDLELIANDSAVIDRSLDSSRFREATGFHPRSWEKMIASLAEDATPYESLRR